MELHVGIYVLVVLTAGAYLPSPLYPGYQEAFGAGDLFMTLTYATFALTSIPALLFLGPASDALGPGTVLRWGIVAAALGSLCFVLADGQGWLIAGRAVQGIALGAATGAAVSLISSGERKFVDGRVKGAAGAAFVGGTAAGPIAAGLLAQYLPAPHTLPFLVHLVLLWIGWNKVAVLRKEERASLRQWRPTRPHVPVLLRPVFRAAALTGFLAWTTAGLFLSVIPTLLDRAGQNDLAVVGGILGTVLLCSLLAQPAVPMLGLRRAQLSGLVALLASLVLLAFSFSGPMFLVPVAAVAAGAGHGLAYGGASAAVENAVTPEQRGAVTGALYTAFYSGAGVPSVAIGLMTLGTSLSTATALVAAAAATAVPVAAAAVRFGLPWYRAVL
ncbi:MFS transporter [Nocardiopsis kunsanensis]|uniref:MFS transporter n=1 Tax=Nocardiopsis kunsanensis TaxID=141693 RepID=A0A919CJH8_9ACTN|nr:MFS transporter [Nocardiopsis kunsanensis]